MEGNTTLDAVSEIINFSFFCSEQPAIYFQTTKSFVVQICVFRVFMIKFLVIHMTPGQPRISMLWCAVFYKDMKPSFLIWKSYYCRMEFSAVKPGWLYLISRRGMHWNQMGMWLYVKIAEFVKSEFFRKRDWIAWGLIWVIPILPLHLIMFNFTEK